MTRSLTLVGSFLLIAMLAGCRGSKVTVDRGDAGEIGEPDAGPPPQRVLVPMHLLGDTPIDNLVHSPQFDPGISMWTGYGPKYAPLPMRREMQTKTPTGLPALRLMSAGGKRLLVGIVRGGPAPLDASIWVGRDIDLEPQAFTVSVVGLVQSAVQDSAFDLVAEPEAVQVIEQIRWQRYSVRINEEVLGLASLVFSDNSTRTIYLNGPVLVSEGASSSQSPRSLSMAKAKPRLPTEGEAEAVRRAMERLRSQPPKPESL